MPAQYSSVPKPVRGTCQEVILPLKHNSYPAVTVIP